LGDLKVSFGRALRVKDPAICFENPYFAIEHAKERIAGAEFAGIQNL
jgi:hypothetical protein